MKNFFRLLSIIGTLPVTLQNGTTADATQVMSDLNWIVNQVNANAAPLANTALTNVNNNFTATQSGIAASSAANFPIASQIQNSVLSTFQSTLGTNTITARCAALALTTWPTDSVFSFVPSQTNTGPSNITVDAAGSSIIFSMGSTLVGGEMVAGVPAIVKRDASKLNLLNPFMQFSAPLLRIGGTVSLSLNSTFVASASGQLVTNLLAITKSLAADVALNNTGTYFDGPTVAQGTSGTWLVMGTVTLMDTAGDATFLCKLWDGTTVISSCRLTTRTASTQGVAALSGFITNPSGNLRISVQDSSSTNGAILFNSSSNGKDSTITALRIA